MIELGNEQDIVQLGAEGWPQVPGGVRRGPRLHRAGRRGRGATKNGKQVLNLADKEKAQAFAVVPENADQVAALSVGRKLLIFPLDQVPEMGRGRGVLLQKSKADRLSDAQAFRLEDGLPWSNRIIPAGELKFWRGERAQAGRMPEKGWPRAKRFKD
jgi:topoisomerase-4 subunit A